MLGQIEADSVEDEVDEAVTDHQRGVLVTLHELLVRMVVVALVVVVVVAFVTGVLMVVYVAMADRSYLSLTLYHPPMNELVMSSKLWPWAVPTPGTICGYIRAAGGWVRRISFEWKPKFVYFFQQYKLHVCNL